MGAGLTSHLTRVLPKFTEGSDWVKHARGPTLRKLFGAYKNPDLWGVYRQFKRVDSDKSGYISYEDLARIISETEFNMLFIWDMFSMQNELMFGREFLTMVCVFSSARLSEKGRFLMTLFDTSSTGTCTGAEIAQICLGVLSVLGKCTGVPVKAKELIPTIREELPLNLREYQEEMSRTGSEAEMFEGIRIIGHAEIDKLLNSIQAKYDELPIAGPPPPESKAPPPPDWGTHEPMAGGTQPGIKVTVSSVGGGGAEGASGSKRNSLTAAGGGAAAVRTLGSSRSQASVGADQPATRRISDALLGGDQPLITITETRKLRLPPAVGWFVVHSVDFATVEKDMSAFRHCFINGVSKALGVPNGCVEVLSITKGSVYVEFQLHPAGRGSDQRDGDMLMKELEEQLLAKESTLRKGRFGPYALGADLRLGETKATAVSRLALGGGERKLHCDASTQASDMAYTLQEVLAELELVQQKATEAEAARDAVLKEVAERDAAIAEIRRQREEERRQAEEAERRRIAEAEEAERKRLEEERLAEERRLVNEAKQAAEEEKRQRDELERQRLEQLRKEEELQRQREKAAEVAATQEQPQAEQQKPLAAPPNLQMVMLPPNPGLLTIGVQMPFLF